MVNSAAESISFDLNQIRTLDTSDGCKLVGFYYNYWEGIHGESWNILPTGEMKDANGQLAAWTTDWRYISDQLIEYHKPDDPHNDGGLITWRLGDGAETNPYNGSTYTPASMICLFPP